MDNTFEITIYRNGRYDYAQNIKLKTKNIIRKKGIVIANNIDYFFTEFGR